jgi:hypothetical protein
MVRKKTAINATVATTTAVLPSKRSVKQVGKKVTNVN